MASKNSDVVEIAAWEPQPHQVAPLLDRSPTLVLSGSAGGGKSATLAEKCHAFALHYPNATVVVSRKVADDMEKSVIRNMLHTVIDIANEPRCTFKVKQGIVEYDNGSEMIFQGMQNERVLKGLRSIGKDGSVDFWWMEEGIEYEEVDFNAVLPRMRGSAAGWTQICVSTNPGPELHWINTRLILGGGATVYLSNASMNKYNDPGYQKNRLDTLTGVDRLRLRDGLWTTGSGNVIDTWSNDYYDQGSVRAGNVTDEADYVKGYGPVYWFADDGYSGQLDDDTGMFTPKSQPRVFLMCQNRKDGLIAVFGNNYQVQRLAEAHIQDVVKIHKQNNWPLPNHAIYDGAAPSLGGELRKAGFKTKPVRVKIDEGVKELRSWCGQDTNGVRKVIVHPRCNYLIWEMNSWSYDMYGKPKDMYDHGPQALEYGVWHFAHGGLDTATAEAYGVDGAALDARIAAAMAVVEARLEKQMAGSMTHGP